MQRDPLGQAKAVVMSTSTSESEKVGHSYRAWHTRTSGRCGKHTRAWQGALTQWQEHRAQQSSAFQAQSTSAS
jgi:hypothetical protein